MMKKCRSGQVFVEFALIMPVYMLFLLCFIQVVLVMHAKFMLDYAAFCAARAGIVSRADMDDMKLAAMQVIIPLIKRVSNNTELALYANAYKLAYIKEGSPNILQPLGITLLNDPSPMDKYNDESLVSPFQLSQAEKLLKIRLEYNFPLDIPLANKIVSELMTGFVADVSTLSSEFYQSGASGLNLYLPLSSVCAMRLTTVTAPDS